MKIGPLWVVALLLHGLGVGLTWEVDARARPPRIQVGDRGVDRAGDHPGSRAGDRAPDHAPDRSGARWRAGAHPDDGARDTPGNGPAAGSEEGSAPAKAKAKARRFHPEDLQRLLRRFAHEPSVEAAQKAALRLVLGEPHRPARWLRRAPRAAWLPKVQLGAGLQQRRDRRLEEEVGSPNLFRADATNQITYEIKLSWDLPRLIFEPNTLTVVREAQRISELREQVVTQVTRLYFERRRLQMETLARPVTTAVAALGREMRLAELTALLNALTGGLFRPGRRVGSVRK